MKTVLVSLLLCASGLHAAGLRAGVGRVDITPQGPIWMSGYASRNHPSEGVVHPLWAKALAVESSGSRVVMVSTEVIGLPAEITSRVAERAQREFGLERSHLLLNSIHTHTGPVVWPNLSTMYSLPPGEETRLREYAVRLVDQLVSVIGAAIKDLAPAELRYGSGRVDFAMNRRQPSEKGIRLGMNPSGVGDHEVPVVKVTGRDGKVRAILFGYACHNTTLPGTYYRINGDYAGFAAVELEKAYPGATALFLMLCGADQDPQPRGKIELAEQHGRTLAAEVRRVADGRLRPVRGPVRTSFVVATLPFAERPRSAYEAELKSTRTALVRRAQRMLQAMDAGRPIRETPYPVQALAFGKDLTVVALGGEVVVDYALRVKREYRGRPLIVAGYSNDVMCYIPSERVLKEGGYEAETSMDYYGQPGPFAPGVEQRIFDAIGKVMKSVR